MTQVDIVLSTSPTAGMYDAIAAPLIDYNTRTAGPARRETITLLLHEPGQRRASGGLWSRFSYDWLFVELLAVPEQLRGKGLGTQLMKRAEDIARHRGAAGIWLDTFSFQARGFYEKLGFSVFGELPGHPRGGARYFMSKTLS
ncbi:GNAT family N-acetyltransferase [Pedomonas sp. V897]|uniref:GNAT family N-acetyltransferase n=1 Tax=Pedomonas sp. V897 TaxID=3446482 RepID=UPI003EE05412